MRMHTLSSPLGIQLNTGVRLREEREKLGMSQTDFGEVGGVRKLAQIKYEKGERTPDADYLARIATAGADVLYILTGEKAALRSALDDVRAATDAANAAGVTTEEYLRIQEAEFKRRQASRGISVAETPLSDRARLVAAISAVEEGLAETRRKLPPDKRAELILAAYDLMAEPEQSRNNVIRMVRAAA